MFDLKRWKTMPKNDTKLEAQAPSMHSHDQRKGSSYRADIDGLRAIAVVSVVVYHAFPTLLGGGFVGVDVFFVISGFLISGIIFVGLERRTFSFMDFYARRVRRIFPALVLTLAVSLIVGWVLLLADEYKQLGKHVAAGAAFVSNFLLWKESGYFDLASQSKPLLHLWSLAIEEQFYLCWPLLLWVAYRYRRSLLTLTLIIALGSFAINILTSTSDSVAAFYSPLSRFWELMIGGILASVTLHHPAYFASAGNLRTASGLVLIAIASFFIRDTSNFPGWLALLPCGGAFLILSAKPTVWLNRRILGQSALVAVGRISYPLYLWHWPALFAMSLLSSRSRISRLVAIVISFVLATLTYQLIEKPIRRSRAMNFSAVGLITAAVACGVVGFVCFRDDGVPSRLPEQLDSFVTVDSGPLRTECFLKDSANFPPQCTAGGTRPEIFIWGDSHANSLAAGFDIPEKSGRISELEVTGASCPPLINYRTIGNTKCEEIVAYALDRIRATQPNIVVMHAQWDYDAYDLALLPETLRRLKETGVGNIVIIGPTPRWKGGLLRSIYRCWKPQAGSSAFPIYSRCGLDEKTRQVDAAVRAIAQRLGVRFVSAYDALCNDRGCLTYTEDAQGKKYLETYDYGHLSEAAARYLVDKLWEQLFPLHSL